MRRCAPRRSAALEHAAALAWPGTEQQWLDGWLLAVRPRQHAPRQFRCAADVSAERALPARHRRLVRAPAGCRPGWPCRTGCCRCRAACRSSRERSCMVRDRPAAPPPLRRRRWRRVPTRRGCAIYERDVPVDVLTAVVDGEVVFADGRRCRGRPRRGHRGPRRHPLGGPVVGAGRRGRTGVTATPGSCAPRCWRGAPSTGRTARLRAGARRQRRRDRAVRVDGFPTAPPPPYATVDAACTLTS